MPPNDKPRLVSQGALRVFKAAAAVLVIALSGHFYLLLKDNVMPYLRFIKLNESYGRTRTIKEFKDQLTLASDFLKANPYGKFTDDLKGEIIRELNIGFLLRDLDSRELGVKTIYTSQQKGYIEKKLLFTDPQVGSFSALLLVPDNDKKPCPAIIGLHGHGDSGENFRDKHFGRELAREGFAVLMISFRAMGRDAVEEYVSEKLYRKGFTLMGLRVYETLLLIKYLKQADFADTHKIGIMGHSGGSGAAFLVSRISPDLQAGVYDMSPLLLNTASNGELDCETIPLLAYYNPQINDISTIPFNVRQFEYGFPAPNDKQEVIGFFKNTLGAKKRKNQKAL